jgi:hypothetical protein
VFSLPLIPHSALLGCGSVYPFTLSQCIIRGVSHCDLAIYIKKDLKAKEELCKLEYFTMQKYNFQKILYKKPKPFKIL